MSFDAISVEQPLCFQFKASFLPCTVLQMIRCDIEAFEKQLTAIKMKMPNFFTGSSLLIDLEKIKTITSIQFTALKNILVMHGFVLMGIRSDTPEHEQWAHNEGLTVLPLSHNKGNELTKVKEEPGNPSAKMVTTPIRSGMQVYAKECDLIVTAAVSPGAELFSDGHIHVYNTLRGRALAGVQGNKEARIFCRSLDAELVAIAGYYLTKEDMQTLSLPDGMMQIYLDNERIRIDAI